MASVKSLALRQARRVIPKRWQFPLQRSALRLTPVHHESRCANAYHCCVHKTASQWIKGIFCHRKVYAASGLMPFSYQRELEGGVDVRPIHERRFDRPFPTKTIVTPLYLAFDAFAAMPKPDNYRAFFVMRDPRDVVVSWYHSHRSNHPVVGTVAENREKLAAMSPDDGLRFTMDTLHERGHLAALASWADARMRDANVMLVKYEDLTGDDGFTHFRTLMDHLDVGLGDQPLREVLDAFSFERLTGRKRGSEKAASKFRKGTPGDWKNHFTPAAEARFRELAGDLPERLGY